MDKFIFYCSLIAVIYTEGVQCKNHGKPGQSDDNGFEIVGGNETTIEEYPYQAFLRLSNGRKHTRCGGSIVSHNYIVTAAHCLAHGIRSINVRIGSTYSDAGGTKYKTSKYWIHPHYDPDTLDYDVGIIKISKGMNLDGTHAKAIRMVNSGYDPKEGEDMILTGWGRTSDSGETTDTLMVVQVRAMSHKRCKKFLKRHQAFTGFTPRMFCAGVAEGGKGVCKGDSGGPATSKRNGKLAGITSFGFGCGHSNSRDVYTLVGNSRVRSFIKSITGV